MEHEETWVLLLTNEQRVAWIEGLRYDLLSRYHDEGIITKQELEFGMAHIARLRLIYRPFPAVRYVSGSALPWGGTIVNDTFYGTNQKPSKPRQGQEDSYDGLYANVGG